MLLRRGRCGPWTRPSFTGSLSAILGIAVAVACLAVGFTIFLAALPRVFLSLSALIALAGWVAMENLGGVLTGSTSDVGTGPVLILLALAFWPLAGTRGRPAGRQPVAEALSLPAPQREPQPAADGGPAG
jgi:hypothetical protein